MRSVTLLKFQINYFEKITQKIDIFSIESQTCRGITNKYSNCFMSASTQLLLGSCMYNFLLPENPVSELLENLNAFHKNITQSKNGAIPFDFKMKLGSSSVKVSVFGDILLYVAAVDYRVREYSDADKLLCVIIYKVFQQNSIFCPSESILIDQSRCVKCGSITGNSRKDNHLSDAVFALSQPTNLKSFIWGQCFCSLLTKSKSSYDDPVILQGTFMLQSPQVLLISLVRSLDHLLVIKTQIAVLQKLDISDFRGIKYSDDATNGYQPVGSINSEGNSTTTVHHVAYLKCSTGVIRINDSNIQHYSDSILESKQFMSTSHTLFYVSTSCIESENEVLQDYVLRLHLQRKVQDILGYSEPTSTLSSSNQSIFASVEIINDFFTILERSVSDINCLPTATQWYLDWERKRLGGVVKLAFDKENVMFKVYIPVNENENHWILVIVFPKGELVVSYDLLKTDFKRNVFNELP